MPIESLNQIQSQVAIFSTVSLMLLLASIEIFASRQRVKKVRPFYFIVATLVIVVLAGGSHHA